MIENPEVAREPRLSRQSRQAGRSRQHTITNRLTKAQTEWKKFFTQQRVSYETTPNANRETNISIANQRTNKYWGDELQAKEEGTLRVYSGNVNGFTLDRRGGQFDQYCAVMKEVQADIVCGQEHNLDTIQSSVRSILYDTTRQHWDRSRINFSNTPVAFKNQYKPGGTFIMTVGNVTGRVRTAYQDRWGRWVCHKLQGRAGRIISIISAYQVVTDSPGKGLITAASQQQSLLIQAHDSTTAPRTAFRRDLGKFLKKCRECNEEILLLGDFNENIGSDPDSMQKLMDENDLADVMNSKHSVPLPTTYARGRKCLDYALATPAIINSVVNAGYEAFNAKYSTDHRAYYVDFSIDQLFGVQIQSLAKFAPRVLKSNNLKQVTAYIKAKHKHLEDHNVFERIHQLDRPGNRHQFAERIDKDVVAASLSAEKVIPKFDVPHWSVELAKARKKVQVLTKWLSAKRTGIQNSEVINQEWQEIESAEALPQTKQQCSAMLREAKKEVKAIVQESYQRRDRERRNRIETLEASTKKADAQEAKRLRCLQKGEAIRHLFEKLKRLRLTKEKTGVTRLEIPASSNEDPYQCTDWRQIDVPSEILHHLRERNRRHFGQAHGTPFTVPPLSDDLGFTGQSRSTEDILRGEYSSEELDGNVKLLLQYLKQTEEIASAQTCSTVTEEEFKAKLRAWRETTTTSPSGLHLGHYKALIANHAFSFIPDEEDENHKRQREELDQMQAELLDVHLRLLNYALQRGYSFIRWQQVANTIIFKEPGNIRIHRTRVIHLYEADYNLAMGLKWRSALYGAEKKKLLNDGQYGSRPNRNAYDPVFIEELQMEISRLTRKTLIQTNYDATACYDRIVPNLAMVTSRKYGVPATVTAANAITLEKAQYRIRTDLGLAEESYRHCQVNPIYGTGQGSGNSPVIWCFLSSTLYDCYDAKAYKAQYRSPDMSEQAELGMVGFVDDSNGQTNQFLEEESERSRQATLHQMRANAQLWSDLLSATGGSLELSKCSYHVMAWQFTGQGSPVLITESAKYAGVTVEDSISGEQKSLKYLSPYASHKTLGHYKEPAGTQREQYKQLKQKSDESVEFMRTCSLTRDEAWTYYYACYLPSIGYPLANSYFTEAQLTNIQRKAMAIIFAKCGYNRNTKREILFGPLELGGANFRHLYDQQGIGQIHLFLYHWRLRTQAGQLLRCAVAWAQYCAGTSIPILEDVHTKLGHLESRWITSLRKYLSHIDARIQVDSTGIAPAEREHDSYIMDHIIASKKFSEAEIRKLNYCRLYLGALTIADLATSAGDRLDNAKLHGTSSLISIKTKWLMVHQEKPASTEWRLWRRANELWSYEDGTLCRPLGRWQLNHLRSRLEHFAYVTSERLYVRTQPGVYLICRKGRLQDYVQRYHRTIRYQDIPINAVPAEIEEKGQEHWRLVHRTAVVQRPRQQAIATFKDYIHTLEAWEIDLLEHTELLADPYTICLELQDSFVAGSDGSEKFGTDGAFGWALSNANGERAAKGMGPSRGSIMDSYRAECSGMLSILRLLVRLAEFTAMDGTWTGTIVTDSQSMLDTVFGRDKNSGPAASTPTSLPADITPLNPMIPEWDLLVEIRQSLIQLPMVKLMYVKGHQDRTCQYNRLDLFAQLNVDADDMAREYQENYGQARPYALMTTTTGAYLVYPEGTRTAKYGSDIRRRATSKPLKQYIQKKNNFQSQTMDKINWRAHGKSMRKHIKHRNHITKMVHECLPTLKHLNRQDNGRRSCPGCQGTLREDRDHILRCKADSRESWRTKFLSSLEEFHTKVDTYRPIRHLLREAIGEWMRSEDDDLVLNADDFHSDVRSVIHQQNEIGWRQIFNGRFGTEWGRVQDDYFARERRENGKNDKRSGERWQTQMISFIWKKWMQLWKIRNEELHGSDQAARNTAKRKEVERELRAAYDNRHRYEPRVQELLCRDIQEQLQRPTWVTQNWLTVNAPVFKDSMKRVHNTAIAGVRSIKTYFASIRHGS